MIRREVNIDPSVKDGYIPAPYELEEGENINDVYLEPVVVKNENGPAIGVTTCGIIIKDGLYFKDMDNSGELSPYKDWRLSPEERAADMVKHLRIDQQAGLALNTLFNNPVVLKREEALDENGNVEFGKVILRHDPDAKPEGPTVFGMSMKCDDEDLTDKLIAGGVYRADMRADASMVALYHNAATQILENEATKGGAAIPYTLHTNPINIGYPDQLGMGAAVLGDGDTSIVDEMAEADRKMMHAEGLYAMYGPQVDISTDPRWPRISGTYGEREDITTKITSSLIKGYQAGEDGLNDESVVLTVKHFPGDGPAENGFEPHMPIGQWRLYPTEGSMEKYHLKPFQAAFDMKASAIMPDYSRFGADGRSVPQTYKGHAITTEEVPSAYCKGLLGDLAVDAMGFGGYVNSDSGIITAQAYGLEDLTIPQRFAKAISAGTDVIGGIPDPDSIVKAVEDGDLPKEDLDRASYRRLLSMFKMNRVDNPYIDPDEADKVREDNFADAVRAAYTANQRSVVLAKNHDGALPLESGKTVCIKTFKGDDPGLALAQAMGAAAGPGAEGAFEAQLTSLFEARGFTVVDDPAKADITYLHVWPILNNIVFNQTTMPVIEMVDGAQVEARERNKSQKKTGEMVTVNTLHGVDDIPAISQAAHDAGGKVIATLVVNNPWLLDKLEPYVDGMTIQYTVSPVAMENALNAQLDVLTGKFNPTGKMCLTMVSSMKAIEITEKEIDGVVREICASPNDVPGYDKDQYIDPTVLAEIPGGSYAYQDADGNYYRSGFGLTY